MAEIYRLIYMASWVFSVIACGVVVVGLACVIVEVAEAIADIPIWVRKRRTRNRCRRPKTRGRAWERFVAAHPDVDAIRVPEGTDGT